MNVYTFTLCILISCFVFNTPTQANIQKLPTDDTLLEIGDKAPNIKLKARRGGFKSLENYTGKIVLVQFWASWCLPCRQFSKDWIRVYEKYKNAEFKTNTGFEVYSVSLDKKKKDWKKASKEDKIPWKANTIDKKGWDSNYAFIYGVSKLPLDFLLDEQGKVLAIDFTAGELDRLLSTMLK